MSFYRGHLCESANTPHLNPLPDTTIPLTLTLCSELWFRGSWRVVGLRSPKGRGRAEQNGSTASLLRENASAFALRAMVDETKARHCVVATRGKMALTNMLSAKRTHPLSLGTGIFYVDEVSDLVKQNCGCKHGRMRHRPKGIAIEYRSYGEGGRKKYAILPNEPNFFKRFFRCNNQ